MENVINNLRKKVSEGSFSRKEMDLLKNINSDELIEIFNISKIDIRNFLIKAYFTTFDNRVVHQSYEKYENTYKIFSQVWKEELLLEKPESLAKSMMIVTFFNTDFVKIIRDNISKDKVSDFESQVYQFILYLNKKIDEGTLVFNIFGSSKEFIPDKEDEELLKILPKGTREYCEKLIDDIEYTGELWKYYISVAKKNEDFEILSKITDASDSKKIEFAQRILPVEVFSKLKNKIYVEEVNFEDLLSQNESHQKAIFETSKNIGVAESESIVKSDLKKSGVKESFKIFKNVLRNKSKLTPNITSENNNISERASRRRKAFKKTPQKRGNGKIIALSVIIMFSISFGFGGLLHKSSLSKKEPIEEAILNNGLKAKITLNEVKIKEKISEKDK